MVVEGIEEVHQVDPPVDVGLLPIHPLHIGKGEVGGDEQQLPDPRTLAAEAALQVEDLADCSKVGDRVNPHLLPIAGGWGGIGEPDHLPEQRVRHRAVAEAANTVAGGGKGGKVSMPCLLRCHFYRCPGRMVGESGKG